MRHTMVARSTIVVLAIFALAGGALARNRQLRVHVKGSNRPGYGVHSRPPPLARFHKLREQWYSLKLDCELLYTDYQSRSFDKMAEFKETITGLTKKTLIRLEPRRRHDEKAKACLAAFEEELKRIEVQKPAEITNHATLIHKFLQGHQIIFNMHLNKTEDNLKELDRTIRICGCENTQKVKNLYSLAEGEIKHLENYMPFTRRAFLDIISHYTLVIEEMRTTIRDMLSEVWQNYNACLNERYDDSGRPVL